MADKQIDVPAPDGLAARLQAALGTLALGDDGQQPKPTYAFWGTQPVAQFGEQPSSAVRARRAGLRDPPLPPPPPAAAACRTACAHMACPLRSAQAADGPIDKPKTVADVKQEPYGLPQK